MAVRAADLTFRNLLLESLQRRDRSQLRNAASLRTDVIELEHDRIAFRAVDAPTEREHLEDVPQVPLAQRG